MCWLVRVALLGELLLSSCDHILDSCGSGLNYHWWGGIKAWEGMWKQGGYMWNEGMRKSDGGSEKY